MQSTSPSRLNSQLDAKLIAYMAASIGAISLAQSAEAKVVYTPVNVTIAQDSQYLLDLNQDGVNDFSIARFAYGNWDHLYAIGLAAADEVLGVGDASALRLGVPIGPKGHFSQFGLMFKDGVISGVPLSSGKWNNVQTRYLGLRFSIDGVTHYGWARLTVTSAVTLTGYAYETIPNKRIISGQTSGTDEVADFTSFGPPQGNLGLLARGADALAIWRRETD